MLTNSSVSGSIDSNINLIHSPVEAARLLYTPSIPSILTESYSIEYGESTSSVADNEEIQKLFPNTYGQKKVRIVKDNSNNNNNNNSTNISNSKPLRIGIVLSGGPAPGGHNVISGLFDYIRLRVHPDSKLYGFKDGPSGLINNKYLILTEQLVSQYRNTGGFHLLGSGRTKIEKPEQFKSTANTVTALELDGLVFVGGDDSNTNAALLAEYFIKNKVNTRVIGCPKTIDGDLKGNGIEVSFGFDTATKVYSEQIAALSSDAISAKKNYHIIRLMGRSASHVTLEVGLQTAVNYILIGEELASKKLTLTNIVNDIVEMIINRSVQYNKNYGMIILPEGLIDFLPQFSVLINELNALLIEHKQLMPANLQQHLSDDSRLLFSSLPQTLQAQLLLDRDDHGNIQVSKIETERLLAQLIELELVKRKFNIKQISIVTHFLGYSGRCGLPSNFDCNYCYSLGQLAGILINSSTNITGYMAVINNLTRPVSEWELIGLPLTSLLNIEYRSGHSKAVIQKALVELNSPALKLLQHNREQWKYSDSYRNPGSIQYWGPFADQINLTLQLEQQQQQQQQQQQKQKSKQNINSKL